MSKINSRNKGGRYERELVVKFSKFWGTDFVRTPFSGAWGGAETTQGHDSVTGDIMTSHDANFPFTVEGKNREGWTLEHLINNTGEIKEWWGQTVRDAEKGGKVPLLAFRRNYLQNDYVTVPYHPELYKELLYSELPMMTAKIMYEDEKNGDLRGFLTITTYLDSFIELGRDFHENIFVDYDWESTEIEIYEREDKTIKESAQDILDMMFD